jgi:MULE transposase domain/SWIM zinc finger
MSTTSTNSLMGRGSDNTGIASDDASIASDDTTDNGNFYSEYDIDDLVDVAMDYMYRDSGGENLEHTHQYNEDIWDEDEDEENEDDRIKNICQAIGIPCKFASRGEAKYKIRLSQCIAKRSFKVTKNDTNQYIIHCRHESCNFFVCARESKKFGVTITDGVGTHNCSVNDHIVGRYKSPASHCDFLALYLREHMCSNTTGNKKLIEKVQQELGCKVTASTMNRALNRATGTYLHNHQEGFKLIEPYVELVVERGGYAHLETEVVPEHDETAITSHIEVNEEALPTSPPERFIRMFVSLKEQKHFASCIEYVSIDATHLQGRFGGMLFCAASLNPNKNLVILAQAIMPTEDYDNWLYFLRHFQMAGLGSNIKFIMSDRDKGLIAAAKQVFPSIPHSKCLRHLSENFKKLFSNTSTIVLKQMAMAFTHQAYTRCRNSLSALAKGADMIKWIDNADPKTWCRSKFPVPRLGVTTSNSIEIVFSTFKKAKHLPPLELLLWIEGYILANRFKMLELAQNAPGTLSPAIVKDLEDESTKATNLHVNRVGEATGTILYYGTSHVQEFSVDLNNGTCTCGRFQEMMFPCSHAVKLITDSLGRLPEAFCSDVHTVRQMKRMYNVEVDGFTSIATTKETLHAFAVSHSMDLVDILPPTRRVLRGRKRKNRIESQSTSSNTKNGNVVCPVCNRPGHRRENCRVNNGLHWAM